MNAATFVRNHTTHDNDLPHQDECPICLDDYTSEQCLRITNIPECSHHIGANCLDDMLRSHSHEEKRCPLCRAVWIPARSLTIPLDAQNLSASQRMADMFAGLDGIGADITSQQLDTRRDFGNDDNIPQQHARRLRRELLSPADRYGSRALREEQQRAPIVIDSDSDDADYYTHVQNFEDFRRDLADIRNRAPYRQMSRSSRRRRVADRTGNDRNINGSSNEGANSNSNSDNAPVPRGLRRVNTSTRGVTDVIAAGAFNRFLNNRRALNPFRPTTENNITTPSALTGNTLAGRRRETEREDEQYREDRHLRTAGSSPPQEFANRCRLTEEQQASNQQHTPGFESPPPHQPHAGSRQTNIPHAHLSGPNTPETPIDIDMTADELIDLSANQPLPAHGAVRSRQLDLREGNLNRREQAMTMRQTILARREVDLIARETRVDELMRVVRRHQEEGEELLRRHGEEIAELLNQEGYEGSE
ncbi:unnamed protein product [Alternaria alternata]